MKLTPLDPHAKISLGDGAALAPRSLDADDDVLEKKMDKLRIRLDELQNALYAESKRALLVVLQARDAGGKDGTIRRVFTSVNPQGCDVTAFRVPTHAELAHDYLWRVHAAVPARGMIGIFNRSHYEDVLAVRVHKLVPKKIWKQRYDQINEFERMLTDNGVIILKFFLHISKEEQRKRFLARIDEPEKNWKFNRGDIEEREYWSDYMAAYEACLEATSSRHSPWFIVPADDKQNTRLIISEIILHTLRKLKMKYPVLDEKRRKELRSLRKLLEK